MITPRYRTLGEFDPDAVGRQIRALAEQAAIVNERDALRARIASLETQLNVVTAERDEARALGRLA